MGEAIERYRVTVLPASPTFLNLMLLANVPDEYDCSSMEVIAYGAEPMPEGLLARLVRSFLRWIFSKNLAPVRRVQLR